jgi:hypothetical protein
MLQKGKWSVNETAHQLFTDFSKDYEEESSILPNILIEFGTGMKRAMLIKMYV